MQIYQCPNCGRTYTEFENIYYCGNCNYKLLKQEEIKKIKHPELSKRDYHIIGTISRVECPYCHSFSTERISGANRSTWFADASAIGKQFQCLNCKAFF